MSEYKKVENAKAEVVCTLEGESWQKAKQAAFRKLASKVEIKGFRKGQAPKNLVEKYISHNEVLLDAAESLAQNALDEAVKEHDITLIDRPELKVDEINDDKCVMTFVCPVLPDVKLGDYKAIEYAVEEVKAEEQEIDDQIATLLDRKADLELKEDGVVEDGDTTVIGGIYSRSTGQNMSSVPFWGSIPILGYFVELITCIVLFTLAGDKNVAFSNPLHWLAVAAILWIVVSSLIALYNLVPIKLDSMTDGYRMTLIAKKENMDAFNELMRIQALQMEGKEVGEIKIFEDITEFTANINLMSVYVELAKPDFVKAEELIDMIIVDPKKISSQTYNRLLAQKLYIKIMTLPLEEVKTYYDKEVNDNVRKFIANDLSMESLRAYILIAGLLDESSGEVYFAKSRKDRALKRAMPSRAAVEEKLYNDALEKVYTAHPDWKVEE